MAAGNGIAVRSRHAAVEQLPVSGGTSRPSGEPKLDLVVGSAILQIFVQGRERRGVVIGVKAGFPFTQPILQFVVFVTELAFPFR
jgi:hypothetical protein